MVVWVPVKLNLFLILGLAILSGLTTYGCAGPPPRGIPCSLALAEKSREADVDELGVLRRRRRAPML